MTQGAWVIRNSCNSNNPLIYDGINALLGHSYYWRVLFLFRLKEFIYLLFMYFILYVLGELIIYNI